MLLDYLSRGLTAGLVAGLAFGLFVALVGSPVVGLAASAGHDHGGHAGAPPVSGAVTVAASVGGGILWGLLLGAVVFGAGHFLVEPALPGGDFAGSLALGALGALTTAVAPWLVVPPSVPGVAAALAPATGRLWFAVMAVAGLVAGLLAIVGRSHWRGRRRALALVGAVAVLAVPVAVAPATALEATWTARTVAVRGVVAFGQLLLWGTLAVAHALLRDPAGAVGADPAAPNARGGRRSMGQQE